MTMSPSKENEAIKYGVIDARVSSTKQLEGGGDSLGDQVTGSRAIAERLGVKVVEVFQ